jgi:hypothetical protein
VIASPLAIAQTKDGIETMAQIVSNLSPSMAGDKLRHTLKNLFFYAPSLQIFNPLLELLKLELKKQTKCFKLLCFHVISHSKLATSAAAAPELATELSKTVTAFVKPHKESPQMLRVFFALASNLPQLYPLLVETLTTILTMDISDAYEKKKKVNSHVRETLSKLLTEAICLLGELPKFDETVVGFLQNKSIPPAIAAISKHLSTESKHQLAMFVGRLQTPPPILLELFEKDDKQILQTPFGVSLLVNNREKFKEVITTNLSAAKGGTLSLLIMRLLEAEGPSDRLSSPIVKEIASKRFTAILPLVEFLKQRPKIVIDEDSMFALYSLSSSDHGLVGFYGLLALSFLTEELDWICGSVCGYLRSVPYTRRGALIRTLFVTWTTAIEHPEILPVFWALFEKTLLFFGDSIDSATFSKLVQRLAEIGASNDFLQLAILTLKKLPQSETAVHLIQGASVVRENASSEMFSLFVQSAKEFAVNTGPVVMWLCDTILCG